MLFGCFNRKGLEKIVFQGRRAACTKLRVYTGKASGLMCIGQGVQVRSGRK